eukprot:RCo052843
MQVGVGVASEFGAVAVEIKGADLESEVEAGQDRGEAGVGAVELEVALVVAPRDAGTAVGVQMHRAEKVLRGLVGAESSLPPLPSFPRFSKPTRGDKARKKTKEAEYGTKKQLCEKMI